MVPAYTRTLTGCGVYIDDFEFELNSNGEDTETSYITITYLKSGEECPEDYLCQPMVRVRGVWWFADGAFWFFRHNGVPDAVLMRLERYINEVGPPRFDEAGMLLNTVETTE